MQLTLHSLGISLFLRGRKRTMSLRSVQFRLISVGLFCLLAACQSVPTTTVPSETGETPITDSSAQVELQNTLPVILFASGSVSLDTQARRQLRQIATSLNADRLRSKRILIRGHSDTRGDASTNLALSRQRAEAVGRELMLNGIKGSRLEIDALGESEPLFNELSAEGTYDAQAADLNRRVELSLLLD